MNYFLLTTTIMGVIVSLIYRRWAFKNLITAHATASFARFLLKQKREETDKLHLAIEWAYNHDLNSHPELVARCLNTSIGNVVTIYVAIQAEGAEDI